MALLSPNQPLTERESFILCRNSQGAEVRATPLRTTRFLVVFEVYNPYSILQLSEVLTDFKIVLSERLVYSGRAVVSNLVNTGIVLVCEVALDDAWLDVDVFSPVTQRVRLREEFESFLKEWTKIHTVSAEFKVVVADMQALLADLRRWLEQVELSIRSTATDDRLQLERDVIIELSIPILPAIDALFSRFEEIARPIPPDLQPVHRTYIKRQLHPLVLCSPFAYRTYQKPLGYAGDYEMVNMILRDPFEGSSLFAKTVNLWFLMQPPARAHRNRIGFLVERLVAETERVARTGRTCRVYDLGCGPAGEVQRFLKDHEICDRSELTLVDFNDETLEDCGRILGDLRREHRRTTVLNFIKKSVHQILKESARPVPPGEKFDFVYCAGLFDYLSDRVCQRLVNLFYESLAPGGLLLVTNVEATNPLRSGMEYLLEWHLVYRNQDQLRALRPQNAPADCVTTRADETGINIYLEVRRPA